MPQHSLPKPFRFDKFWIKHPECHSVIKADWDFFVLGSSAFILVQKLKSTKHAMKIWNTLSFGNIQKIKIKKIINFLSQVLDGIQQFVSNLIYTGMKLISCTNWQSSIRDFMEI